MENRKMIFLSILFYGGLWGLMEATIGYVLHLLPCGFSGMLMFPIGFYCMFNAYKLSNCKPVIFYTASVATLIKLTDLLIPLCLPMSVINPVVSILLESLIVFGFVSVRKTNPYYRQALMMSLSWIVLFVLIQQFLLKPATGLYQNSFVTLSGIIGLNTLFSGLLIGTYLKVLPELTIQLKRHRFSYVQSFAVIFIAVIFELGNSLW